MIKRNQWMAMPDNGIGWFAGLAAGYRPRPGVRRRSPRGDRSRSWIRPRYLGAGNRGPGREVRARRSNHRLIRFWFSDRSTGTTIKVNYLCGSSKSGYSGSISVGVISESVRNTIILSMVISCSVYGTPPVPRPDCRSPANASAVWSRPLPPKHPDGRRFLWRVRHPV